ncbi:class I SAM-dependent methyltransferase [Shouchella miscanthi]|uniref:class I SAM-dependent methyltransferase n=1 Tax=Shouchella miscanthi TaxID=2598861 RepID=UPI001643BE9D|nr:class I SAM-dependent methyltransferase [Shouchella miscanthi]
MDKEYEKKATAYYQGINQQLFSLIDPKVEMVLDIGCAEGALGAAIKAAYGADVHGFELFQHAAVQAEKKLDSVTVGNIESDPLPFEHEQFDAIIFADVLEHTLDPWSVLAKVKPYLKKTSAIYASIPNVGHISIIEELIQGTWNYVDAGLLDKTHFRFFTKSEIEKLFHTSGYQVETIVNNQVLFPHQQLLMQKILEAGQLAGLNTTHFYEQTTAYQYMLKAKPSV